MADHVKHWLVYALPREMHDRNNEVRYGEVFYITDVSERAAILKAQDCAAASPGSAYAVCTVEAVYVADVPVIVSRELPEAPQGHVGENEDVEAVNAPVRIDWDGGIEPVAGPMVQNGADPQPEPALIRWNAIRRGGGD